METDRTAAAPAWRRRTAGEHRWPAALAIVAAVVLQLVLPDPVLGAPRYLLPAVEVALLVVLVAVNPFRIDRTSRVQRMLGLAILAAIALSNGWSEVLLVQRILGGHAEAAGPLLGAGVGDLADQRARLRAGLLGVRPRRPRRAGRGRAARSPTSCSPRCRPPSWRRRTGSRCSPDYLYLSFTNATAFSPTDVLPLSRWAKLLMLVQSAVALAVVVLVVARAVNVLG